MGPLTERAVALAAEGSAPATAEGEKAARLWSSNRYRLHGSDRRGAELRRRELRHRHGAACRYSGRLHASMKITALIVVVSALITA